MQPAAGGRLSIATRTAIILSVAIGLIFALAAAASYRDARDRAVRQALAKLDSYNHEIASEQEERFQRIVAAHRHAGELLAGELKTAPPPDQLRSRFDRLFPRRGDGTRRTSDALFDGGDAGFGYVRGVGGFVAEEPAPEQARLLLAATRIIHAIGEGLRPELKSMSFFTPTDTLVMFAPDRPDRLLYYRKQAPADMTLKGREFLDITLPANNPERRTRCTSLQPILYDASGKTWTTGCMTPVYVDGRYVGGWGSSLLLDDLLAVSQFDGLPDTDVILISREGRLIRHPHYTRQNHAGTQRHLALRRADAPELKALWRFVRGLGNREFLGAVPELDGYAAVRRIPTPGWYAVTLQRDRVVAASARRALARIGITAVICLLLQAILLFVILRRNVRTPLRRLVGRAQLLAERVAGTAGAPHAGGNEVEQLSASFAQMADQVIEAHVRLEARVAERTGQLAELNEELRRLVDTDPLTGLLNRRRIMRDMARMTGRRGSGGSLILFDVDHFKAINDTHGHAAGDKVLRALARAARAQLRLGELLARIGGEEFLLLLPRTEAAVAMEIAERLREAIAALAVKGEAGAIRLTISLGVAQAVAGEGAHALYCRADAALYDAKHGGRNRTRMAPPPGREATPRAA